MPQTTSNCSHPRQRLSLNTHSALGQDVSAALKASPPLTIRTTVIRETPAPPPSPIDFGFESYTSQQTIMEEWRAMSRRAEEGAVGA